MGSPYINRFLQPDSLIPNPANPQAFNRFGYVLGNPINFNDPSGHYPTNCGPDNIYCGGLPENDYYHRPAPNQGGGGGGDPHDKDGDGIPDVPDSDLELASLGNDFTTLCAEGQTPVECWYLRQPMDMLDAPLNLTYKDLNALLLAIFFDVKRRDVSGIGYYGRGVYDTPFWNAWGLLPGDICVDDTCYKRQEVNYIAQGMWAAHSGHTIEKSHSTVENWKDIYREDPSAATYYWNDVGYNAYHSLNPYYSELSVVYK